MYISNDIVLMLRRVVYSVLFESVNIKYRDGIKYIDMTYLISSYEWIVAFKGGRDEYLVE